MTISADDIGASVNLPPERAIRFLGSKQAQVTGPWTQWLDGQHASGFTAANVAKLDVLHDIQNSLRATLAKGQTFEQWQDGLIPELQRKGWLGNHYSTEQLRAAGRIDADTGEIRKGLTPARLKTIFQTNMQSAMMEGRDAEMLEQAETRPYWKWVTGSSKHHREAHQAMSGRIFRYDDGLWGQITLPNGHNCKCRKVSYNERQLKKRGLTVSSTAGKVSEVQVPLRDGTVATVIRYTDPSLPGGYFQTAPGFRKGIWQPRLESKDAHLSRQYIETALQGPAFERFVQGKDAGVFPVAVLPAATPTSTQSRAMVAYLTDKIVAAQRQRHPGISLIDYRRIPEIIDNGNNVAEGDRRLTYTLADTDGSALRLVLDDQDDGSTLVTSLERQAP